MSTADTQTPQWNALNRPWNGTYPLMADVTSTVSRNGDLVHKMYIEVGGQDAGGTIDFTTLVSHGSRPSISKSEVRESTDSQDTGWSGLNLQRKNWYNWNC